MWSMSYNPSAVDEWLDALNRFAGYRNELVEVLNWFGEEWTKRAQANHDPGGFPVFTTRTGYLVESIGFSLEAVDLAPGVAGAIPTLFLFATAPYAESVEFGTATSRPFPYFFNNLEDLFQEAFARVVAVMAKADSIRVS